MESRKEEIRRLVAFCILMQNDIGILGKSPSYIAEKYQTVVKDGSFLLDSTNTRIYIAWREEWERF